MDIKDYLDFQPKRQLDKSKRHKSGFNENVQDDRKARIGFKRYIRQIEEETLLDIDDDIDLGE